MADTLVTNTVTIIPDWTSGGGGGGGAPANAQYWTGAADATLSAEHNLGALGTGLVKNTAGTPSIGVAGTDYQAPLTAGVDYEVPLTFSGALGRAVNTVTVQANGITDAMLRDSAALSVIGRSANTSGDPADIAAGSDNTVLRRSGTSIGFGTVTGSMMSGFTDTTLPVANASGQLVSSAITLVTNTLTHSASSSGGAVSALISNTSNTASSTASLAITVAGSSAGNPRLRLSVNGATDWDVTVDNSNSDRFALVCGATTPMIAFTSGNGVAFGGGAPSDARKRFYVLQSVADDWLEIENTVSTNAVRNLVLRNNGGRELHIATLGSSAAGTGHFGLANAGLKYIVSNDSSTSGIAFGSLDTGPVTFGTNNTKRMEITGTGNIGLFTAGSYGSGTLVLFVANATTVPTTNPTGGAVWYVESGASKARGSGGTVTTFGPAEPHCPQCGRDYMKEFDNASYGYFALCLPCLADELGERPWILRGRSRLPE